MNRILKLTLVMILGALLMIGGCSNGSQTTTPTVSMPPDNPSLAGNVCWLKGDIAYDDTIGTLGNWSLQVADKAQWDELVDEYSLKIVDGNAPNFEKFVILVLFFSEYEDCTYSIEELAMRDGMANIGIGQDQQGNTPGHQLRGCLVELDEEPLEINSYIDRDSLG